MTLPIPSGRVHTFLVFPSTVGGSGWPSLAPPTLPRVSPLSAPSKQSSPPRPPSPLAPATHATSQTSKVFFSTGNSHFFLFIIKDTLNIVVDEGSISFSTAQSLIKKKSQPFFSSAPRQNLPRPLPTVFGVFIGVPPLLLLLLLMLRISLPQIICDEIAWAKAFPPPSSPSPPLPTLKLPIFGKLMTNFARIPSLPAVSPSPGGCQLNFPHSINSTKLPLPLAPPKAIVRGAATTAVVDEHSTTTNSSTKLLLY